MLRLKWLYCSDLAGLGQHYVSHNRTVPARCSHKFLEKSVSLGTDEICEKSVLQWSVSPLQLKCRPARQKEICQVLANSIILMDKMIETAHGSFGVGPQQKDASLCNVQSSKVK